MKALLAGMVLIAACDATGGATTSPPKTSTTTGQSTSTAPSSTTSEVPASTSEASSETPAVVASRYGLMGWWSDGWVLPEGLEDIPLTGGEQYQVVMLDAPVTTAIGSVPDLCEPSLTPVLEFDPPLPGEFGDPGAVAVIAGWELRPSPVRVETDLADMHIDALTEVLASIGVVTEPIIFQQVVADIDSDDVEEVVIVAKLVDDTLIARPGDYSVVVLRKIVEEEWQTAILETSVAEPNSPYVLSHAIAAVADLNGDGKMEIVVDASYYEGSGTAAYEYIDDDLGPQAVLGGGCGA